MRNSKPNISAFLPSHFLQRQETHCLMLHTFIWASWKELTGVELCQSCVRLWREYPFHAPWIIIGVIHTTKRRRFNLDNCRFIALLYLQIDCFHAPVCNTAHDGAAGMILIGRDLHSRHFLAQKSNLPVPCLWRYYGNH